MCLRYRWISLLFFRLIKSLFDITHSNRIQSVQGRYKLNEDMEKWNFFTDHQIQSAKSGFRDQAIRIVKIYHKFPAQNGTI